MAVTCAAYHYSLWSLFQSLGLETPLAYVGLVPVIALLLAMLRARPLAPEPAIHDRQVDYIVGLPLMAAALAVNLLLPRRLSSLFWVARVDLFTLPFFVAGAVAVLFGVRVLWRQRLAIGFLFFAWPLPYSVLLLRFLNGFTGLTIHALRLSLQAVRVAAPVASADGSVFQVLNQRHPFPISVVSACSGINGMVGFLLVGTALTAIVRGPRLRKIVWLVTGLAFIWMMNLGRVLLILWAGQRWGEKVAIDVLHPYAGLVTFNGGVAVVLVAMRLFGLSIPTGRAPGSAPATRPTVPAVPRVTAAAVVVAMVGTSLGLANTSLRSYDLVANALGAPKLWSLTDNPFAPDGWRPLRAGVFAWAKPYFGESSTWLRYSYRVLPKAAPVLHSELPVVADVIDTTDVRTFSAYGIEACYRFHGYRLRHVEAVRLGAGLSGQTLSYVNARAGQDWSVLYWIWPVKSSVGTRYERVTLYLQNTGRSDLKAVREFLVRFGRTLVAGQETVPIGSKLRIVPIRRPAPVSGPARGSSSPSAWVPSAAARTP